MHNFCPHRQRRRFGRMRMHPEEYEECVTSAIGEGDAEGERGKNGRNHQNHHRHFLRRSHPKPAGDEKSANCCARNLNYSFKCECLVNSFNSIPGKRARGTTYKFVVW